MITKTCICFIQDLGTTLWHYFRRQAQHKEPITQHRAAEQSCRTEHHPRETESHTDRGELGLPGTLRLWAGLAGLVWYRLRNSYS